MMGVVGLGWGVQLVAPGLVIVGFFHKLLQSNGCHSLNTAGGLQPSHRLPSRSPGGGVRQELAGGAGRLENPHCHASL
jgi:hypothetical protein